MRISTIIPAFNRADLIPSTLDSLLGQTRAPDEIIVVDDGSNDGTPDAVSAYGERVRLIVQDNAGPGAARNRGFAECTGDIIHFMDSDDLVVPSNYERQVEAFVQGADLTYGPWLKARFEGTAIYPEPVVIQQQSLPEGKIDRILLTGDWITVFQPCLFRRQVIEAAGPYRTDLRTAEDIELLYRICRLAQKPVHTPGSLILYRIHPEGQISEQEPKRRVIDRAKLWAALAGFASEDNLDSKTSRKLAFQLREAAASVAPFEPGLAESLEAAASQNASTPYHLEKFLRRVSRKLRRNFLGDKYGAHFGVGPLRPDQIQEIEKMGFSIKQDNP